MNKETKNIRIGIIIDWLSTYYHVSILDSVCAGAQRHGIDLFIYEIGRIGSELISEYPRVNVAKIIHNDLDGILLASPTLSSLSDNKYFLTFLDQLPKIPRCHIGMYSDTDLYVSINQEKAVSHALDHLYTVHGARTFAFLSGTEGNTEAQNRLNAFTIFIKEKKLEPDSYSIFDGNFRKEDGVRAAENILQARGKIPEAVLASNDYMAIGYINTMKKQGYEYPRDYKIIGFDNHPESEIYQLTSIENPIAMAAEKALELLLESIKKTNNQKLIELTSQLIVRSSCGCIYDLGKQPQQTARENPINGKNGYELDRRVEREEALLGSINDKQLMRRFVEEARVAGVSTGFIWKYKNDQDQKYKGFFQFFNNELFLDPPSITMLQTLNGSFNLNNRQGIWLFQCLFLGDSIEGLCVFEHQGCPWNHYELLRKSLSLVMYIRRVQSAQIILSKENDQIIQDWNAYPVPTIMIDDRMQILKENSSFTAQYSGLNQIGSLITRKRLNNYFNDVFIEKLGRFFASENSEKIDIFFDNDFRQINTGLFINTIIKIQKSAGNMEGRNRFIISFVNDNTSTQHHKRITREFNIDFPLTDRKREVLEHLLANSDLKTISATLDMNLNTLKAHAHQLYQYLGVQSRVELYDFMSEYMSVDE